MGDKPARHLWNVAIMVVATLLALIIPLRLVVDPFSWPNIVVLEVCTTLLFGIDAFRRWRLNNQQPKASGRGNSIQTLWLLADVIAALPLVLMTGHPKWQLIRLVKLSRVAESFIFWRRREVRHAGYLRLTMFICWVSIATHWLACGWLVLRADVERMEPVTGYLKAVYWTVQTLSTVGYGDVLPTDNMQMAYAICVMLFGVGIYGYVIGNVAGILSNIDPAKNAYVERMEQMSAFMRYRKIPTNLRERIHEYHEYLWENRLGSDESSILSSLPPGLQAEVSLFLKKDIIEKVPLFKGASEEFVKEMALQMQSVVYMPGDFVFRAGEHGRDMYFVSKGVLDAVSADGSRTLSTLKSGDFFGEIALFHNVPRTATVIAKEYCDLYRLDKTAFERVLSHYPEIASKIELLAKERKERG